MSDDVESVLFRGLDGYPTDKVSEHLFEQYRLYLEMADRISTRRQSANTFFLAVNSALVGLASYPGLRVSHWLICAGGIVLCYVWYRLVRSYRDLNTAKFKVVHMIESRLPASPYDAEWEAVGRGENPKLYLPFTRIEMRVPWVFLALYVVVMLRSIPFCQVQQLLN